MLNDDFEALDAWFEAKGMQSEPTPTNVYAGRIWAGSFNDVPLSVSCTRRSRTKHHSSELATRQYAGHEFYVEITDASPQIRLTLSPRQQHAIAALVDNFFMKRVGMREASIEDTRFEGLKIWIHDDRWARQFLRHEQIPIHIAELLPTGVSSTTFSVQPDAINFRTRRPLQDLTPDAVSHILSSVTSIAHVVRTLDAPSRIAKRSRFEGKLQASPAMAIIALVAAILGIAVVIPLLLLAVIAFGLIPYLLGGVLLWFVWRRFRKPREVSTAEPIAL